MTSGTSPALIALPQNFGPDATITGLKENALVQAASASENIVWKDLGQYLETLSDAKYEESQFKNELDVAVPLNTAVDCRVCTLCNRPILVHHLAKHIKSCLQHREQQQQHQQEQEQQQLQMKNTVMDEAKNKKRKAEKESTPIEDTRAKVKKPKRDPAAPRQKKKTNPKNKGPVDVEKQCGVALPGGGLCARSLTCKTHSMGAKRAVPGRSASYDVLLAAYQHKNQVKIAGQAAKLQEEKDEMLHAGSATLDSDEETHQVLSGVQRSFPLPLERKSLIPTRVRSNFLRMREMFAGAILPRITNSNGMGGFNGRAALLDIDKPNEYFHVVRAPQRMLINKPAQAQQAQQSQTQGQQQMTPQPNGHASMGAGGHVPQPMSGVNTPNPASLVQQQTANRNALMVQQQAAVAARQKAMLMQQQASMQYKS